MFYIASFVNILGLYLFVTAKTDHVFNDSYGFAHLKAYKPEGNEFPIADPISGDLSKTFFLCRHPRISSFLHFMIAGLLYGTISWGRLIFTTILLVGTVIGVQFEEMDLLRNHGEAYQRYMDMVPSQLIPDLRSLLISGDYLNDMRKQLDVKA